MNDKREQIEGFGEAANRLREETATLRAENESLRAEVARLRDDAERYRYLRSERRNWNKIADAAYSAWCAEENILPPDAVDRVVDAAIAARSEAKP